MTQPLVSRHQINIIIFLVNIKKAEVLIVHACIRRSVAVNAVRHADDVQMVSACK